MERIKFVVFIDDNEATNYYHKVIMDDLDLFEKMMFFSSPEKALIFFESLKKKDAGSLPDIIFLDINMPRMNGWEFLEEFANISLDTYPKVYMLTNSSSPQDKELAVGHALVHGFFSKPMEGAMLQKLQAQNLSLEIGIG